MVKVVCALCFTIVVLATLASGRKVGPNNNSLNAPRNVTKVCDPARYRALGLDMSQFMFCDSSLPIDIRINDLIGRMTLDEKAQQLGDHAQGVDRLGLPSYKWWSEALHGVSNVGGGSYFDAVVPGATSFPTPISVAAAFNEKLWRTIGQAVSTEARGMHNVGHAGLTFWSPNINVVRDPRWGRTLETSGEDPYVVGRYATNYVRGLQDIEGQEHTNDPRTRPLKVAACCKHYVAYDVDHWKNIGRKTFNAVVQERDMIETFQKPFEMCVLDGDVASVMCSYNKVDGLPTCADAQLLKETVRGKWGLNGYIVSDCDSVEVMHDMQHFLQYTPEEDVAIVLRAGLDLDCGAFYPRFLANAVNQGKVRVPDMDNALHNLYLVLARLGYFDGRPEFQNLGPADVCTEEHINLATQAARESMVLLKNDRQALPLIIEQIKNIAVIGPHSNATDVMIGNYAGVPCRYATPLNALQENVDVIHAMGCDDVPCGNEAGIPEAMQAAQQADATVLIVGINQGVERESWDRSDLLLPGFQNKLITQVASVSKGPVILVIMSAGCIDIGFAKDHPNITSIIWAGYPGEEGGTAIADVIFGKFNPSGRLPHTWYENSYISVLPMWSMPLRSVAGYPGRTYKFFDGPVVYPFGHGLSYTNFSYKVTEASLIDVQLDKYTKCHDIEYVDDVVKPACPAVAIDDLHHYDQRDLAFSFSVEVTNIGSLFGSDTVLIYWVPPKGIVDAPIKQLIGFHKVFLQPGASQVVNFRFRAKDLAFVDSQAYTLLVSGAHTILIGNDGVSFPFNVNIH